MNKKNKKSLAKLGVILISATILSACGNNQGANKATKNINCLLYTSDAADEGGIV